MIDASINDYVKYTRETLKNPELSVSATCIVRPFYFLVDGFKTTDQYGITLAPYYEQDDSVENEGKKYGKAQHLPLFSGKNKNKDVKYQRILVVNEIVIAEMFLSGYIDMILFNMHNDKQKDSKCPICQWFDPCHFSKNGRDKNLKDLKDIHEIYWFEHEVNKNQDVNLIYTFLKTDSRVACPELDDRVTISKFISKNQKTILDIQFQFMNLENGILRIRWGEEKTTKLPYTNMENRATTSVRVTTLDPDNFDKTITHDHFMYQTFSKMLESCKAKKDKQIEKMILHLNMLKELVGEYFNKNSIDDIRVEGDPADIKKLLDYGSEDFHVIINSAIKTLEEELNKCIDSPTQCNLKSIYDIILKHYRDNGIPPVAYIVAYDKAHYEYPVRVVQVAKNWNGVIRNV